jgi:two-component system nitrate/nitrite response regulator NarL
MIRVLIAADIRLYREGLAQLLAREDGIAIAGAVDASRPALSALRPALADVIVLEVSATNHLLAVRDVRALAPGMSIVALGVADADADMVACAEMGATAYVTRDASLAELVAAVRSAARGEFVCSPRTAGTLVRRLAELAADRLDPSLARLTRRECEIAALIHEGLSNKEIAVRLSIETATVKNHVHNLLEKLNVHHRTEAGRLIVDAMRRGHLPMAPATLASAGGLGARAAS